MFDIGIGEIILVAIVGLLIFGPEKLPRAAADAAKWLNQIRGMATSARQDLADSAGIDLSDTVDTVKSLQEFHPKRIASSFLSDSAGTPAKPAPKAEPPTSGAVFDPDAT